MRMEFSVTDVPIDLVLGATVSCDHSTGCSYVPCFGVARFTWSLGNVPMEESTLYVEVL